MDRSKRLPSWTIPSASASTASGSKGALGKRMYLGPGRSMRWALREAFPMVRPNERAALRAALLAALVSIENSVISQRSTPCGERVKRLSHDLCVWWGTGLDLGACGLGLWQKGLATCDGNNTPEVARCGVWLGTSITSPDCGLLGLRGEQVRSSPSLARSCVLPGSRRRATSDV